MRILFHMYSVAFSKMDFQQTMRWLLHAKTVWVQVISKTLSYRILDNGVQPLQVFPKVKSWLGLPRTHYPFIWRICVALPSLSFS